MGWNTQLQNYKLNTISYPLGHQTHLLWSFTDSTCRMILILTVFDEEDLGNYNFMIEA